jgi:hypothetical protein
MLILGPLIVLLAVIGFVVSRPVRSSSGKVKIVLKTLNAFWLGLLGFGVGMFVGETTREALPALFVLALYFFVSQFLLSRGNPEAHHEDWPIMLALNAVWLGVYMVENPAAILSQNLGILLSTGGGTYAGALAASLAAHRTGVRH